MINAPCKVAWRVSSSGCAARKTLLTMAQRGEQARPGGTWSPPRTSSVPPLQLSLPHRGASSIAPISRTSAATFEPHTGQHQQYEAASAAAVADSAAEARDAVSWWTARHSYSGTGQRIYREHKYPIRRHQLFQRGSCAAPQKCTGNPDWSPSIMAILWASVPTVE